jgi:hypothetical protein
MKLASSGTARMKPRRFWRTRLRPMRASVRSAWKPVHFVWARRRRQTATPTRPPWRGATVTRHSTHLYFYFRMCWTSAGTFRRPFVQPAATSPKPGPGIRSGGMASLVLNFLKTTTRHDISRQTRRSECETTLRHERRHDLVVRTMLRWIASPASAPSIAPQSLRGRLPEASSARQLGFLLASKDLVQLRRRTAPSPVMLDHRTQRSAFMQHSLDRVVATRAAHALSRPPRSPELIWRTLSDGRSPDMAGGITHEAAMMAMPLPTPATSASTLQMASVAAARPAAPLDKAMVDRIAEDVIGRVERRMRIERERRGA